MNWKAKMSSAQQVIIDKRNDLMKNRKLVEWKEVDGTVSPEQAVVEHADWKTVSIPHSWTPSDTAKTFYCRLQVPSHFNGIPLQGSRVELEINSVIGMEVFVNGEHRYGVEYWADTQIVPILLAESFESEQSFDIVIQSKQGDGFGFFTKSEVGIQALDEWIFKLDTFSEELGFVQFLAENNRSKGERLEILEDALKLFEEQPFINEEWQRIDTMIKNMRERLKPFSPLAKAYKVYLAGHAHIDMNWLWPWEETVDLIRRDFESMDAILEQYPEVRFSHSQAATYQVVQKQYPQLWKKIKKHIDEGRWEVTASTWVEGDLNMSGYETLARQLLLGKTYAREELGVDPEICWEPDTFGHPASMPHLLRQAGIKYYYHVRAGKGSPVYWWEDQQGSRILVFNDPNSYSGRIFASDIMPSTKSMEEQYGLKSNLYVYGIGDHGGGITRQDVERALALNKSALLPQFSFSKTTEFYQALEQSNIDFPVIYGELNTIFEGCYSSHGDIKKANRETEQTLVAAETFAAMTEWFSKKNEAVVPVDKQNTNEQLKEAWQRHCFNQFHDILCGCSIHESYNDAINQSVKAKATAEELVKESVAKLVPEIRSSESADSNSIIVFNSLSWNVTDVVEVTFDEYPQVQLWQTGDELEDSDGKRTVVQRTDHSVLFIAHSVPSFGFKGYKHQANKNHTAELTAEVDIALTSAGNFILKNDAYQLEIDRESGTIQSLLDRITSRELSYTPQGEWVASNQTKGLLNLLEVQYEAPHPMSAWKLGTITRTQRLVRDAKIKIAQQGPVLQSVSVTHEVDNTRITQEIRLYRGINRIDFKTDVDWGGSGSGKTDAPMLRVLFTPKIEADECFADIPFGAIKRFPDGREIPAIHWIDVSESGRQKDSEPYGMALLNNGKYGHSMQGNTMGITLVRSSYEPDNRPDIGHHSFTYSIVPHPGSWQTSQTDRRGWELNRPLLAVPADNANSSAVQEGQYSALLLEERTATGWVPAQGAVITQFKLAEGTSDAGERAWAIRIMEAHGRKTELRLKTAMPVQFAEEVSLIEDALKTIHILDPHTIPLGTIQAAEVRSYRLG